MRGDEAWKAIDEARRLLGLGREATLKEVHRAYHDRARTLHPDLHPPEREPWCREQMAAANAAYALLRGYCEGHRFSFDAEEIRRELARRDPRVHWWEQFGQGPM